LSSGEGGGQSVPSPTRSSPEKQCPNAPKAVLIAIGEVPQISPLNPNMFNAYEVSPLIVVPGSSTDLSSELGDSKSAEFAATTRVVLRRSDMSSIRGDLETPSPFPSYLLRPREQPPAETLLVSKLISQVLCSFPERKMNAASCPPFIHHSLFLRSMNTILRDDPIIICQDICHKFAVCDARTPGDFSLWDVIAAEQERIYEQRAAFDKWLHLSSAQAMTIYLLMLAAEGEAVLTHHPSLLITLLFTLGTNFEQLNQIHPGFMAAKEQGGGRPAWEDWIFAESKLRTATVYFILGLHFDVNFGLPRDPEGDYRFEDVELPAVKVLWVAKDEISWREEFDLAVPHRISEARLNHHDLVRLNRRECDHKDPASQKVESRLTDRIEKWHKEMDEFGMLVALCSTMV
jgi:hypothetical protein